MAAVHRHFGQQITSRSNPDADHAVAFVAKHDPEGQFAPAAVDPPIGRLVEINYNGIKRTIRIDGNGRGRELGEAIRCDGWSNRRTFTSDAEALVAAKWAGGGLRPDRGRAAAQSSCSDATFQKSTRVWFGDNVPIGCPGSEAPATTP
jgi:hypothetical protein